MSFFRGKTRAFLYLLKNCARYSRKTLTKHRVLFFFIFFVFLPARFTLTIRCADCLCGLEGVLKGKKVIFFLLMFFSGTVAATGIIRLIKNSGWSGAAGILLFTLGLPLLVLLRGNKLWIGKMCFHHPSLQIDFTQADEQQSHSQKLARLTEISISLSADHKHRES